jgi:hypothetical protein
MDGEGETLLDVALQALIMASRKIVGGSRDEMPSQSDVVIIFASPSDIVKFIDMAKNYLAKFPKLLGKWTTLFIPYTRIDPAIRSINYQNIIRERTLWEMRIIVCTPLIEVGANLPRLAAIIDSGRSLVPVYYPFLHRTALISLPVSKFTVEQRKGRVGRTGPGTAYFLYTKLAHEAMQRTSIPSTLTSSSISYTIYRVASRIAVRLGGEDVGFVKQSQPQDLNTQQTAQLKLRLAIAAKHIGVHQPRIDISNDIDLLTPISMDSQLTSLIALSRSGLLDETGAIGEIGLQISAIRATSTYEALLRTKLMCAMVHPIDITLICTLAERGLQTIDKGPVAWKEAVQKYVVGGVISGKRVVIRLDGLMQIYGLGLDIIAAMTHPDWDPAMKFDASRLALKGAEETMIDTEKLKITIIDIITDYDGTSGISFAKIGDRSKVRIIHDSLDSISKTYREEEAGEVKIIQ